MQLPSDIRDFTGRDLHVEQLCELLSPDENQGAVPVALVAGAGGLGKTTLAIHAAHRMRSEYPDGQLYVDLLGASAPPLSPAEVLARFLRDLGVQGAQIPVGERVADALEYLVDAHLLESTAPDCYSFHDLLLVYAAERAFADEAREVTYEAVHRIVAWYLHTASAANAVVAPQRDTVPLEPLPPGCTSLTFRDISGALDWSTQERANIVAATRQAADEGLHDIAWKLPVAVLGCFNALSYRAEWLASHLVALASAQRAGDRQAEAWVLNNLGMVCIQQRMDDAIGYFDQALAIGRDIGDRRAEAQAANNLADAYIELGRPEDALEPLKRTLALQIEVGHRYGQGVTLNNLGEAYLDLGRPEEAIDSIEQARSIFVEIKTLRGEGSVAHNLGRAYMDLGRPDEAVRYFRSALHIRQAAGERHGQALTLLFLGRAYRRLGRIDDARRTWADARVIFEDLGDEAQLAESRAELTSISVPTA